MGALGQAMIFFCSIVGGGILAAITLSLTARSFLVIVEDTAAGIDRVRWPEEPIQDWLARGARFAALLAIWLVPAGILSNALERSLFPGHGGLRFLVLAVPGLWLYVPVGLLSAMSSDSGWALFRPAIAWRLLRLAPSLVVFYLLTGLLAFAVAGLGWVSLFTSFGVFLLPVVAVAAAVGTFIYARQLGRLGWLVGRLGPLRKPAPKTQESEPRPHPRKRKPTKAGRKRPRRPETLDPWAVPAEAERSQPNPVRSSGYPVVDPDADSEPYALAPELPSAPPTPPPAPVQEELDPEEAPSPRPEPSAPADRPPVHEPSELELSLYDRGPKDPPPAHPFFSGVYTFPFYPDSLRPLVWLATGYFFFGVFAWLVAALWMG
jgi:hypothetical protein